MRIGARQRDAGVVAVLALLFVLAMGALLALSFNIGLMLKARGDLQGASDSAVLAAAGSLNGTIAGLTDGSRQAQQFSAAHRVTGQTVRIDQNEDVEYGFWHFRAGEPCVFGGSLCVGPRFPGVGFEPREMSTSKPFAVTAARVNNGRDDEATHNPAMVPLFGAFLDNGRYQVRSAAVAVGRRSQVDCALPIAIAGCSGPTRLFTGGELNCGGPPQIMTFTNDMNESLGWIDFVLDNTPSTNDVRNRIVSSDADCAAREFRTGVRPVANGNNLGPIIPELLGYVGNTPSGTCLLGVRRTMAVLDNCPGTNPDFTGPQLVMGFVTVVITALQCPSGKTWSTDGPMFNCGTRMSGNPCAGGGGGGPGPPPGPALTLQVLCDPPGTGVGAGGGVGSRIHLVR